ncbi:MAG TPA: hypothetical protein VN915_14735 [Elusimicrobiota bacterium]|nr:hypothetical protein [Elusimicrobiota bacterium]
MLRALLASAVFLALAAPARAQIDPQRRVLLLGGYEQGLLAPGPVAPYAYAYMNVPEVAGSSSALRLVVAPVYVDSEMGFLNVIGKHADAGVGFSGGGYAFGQTEVRRGDEKRGESFTGHGGGPSLSLYPKLGKIGPVPINGYLRGAASWADYRRNYATAPEFVLPPNEWTGILRFGIRAGGRPPGLDQAPSGEVSVWYEARDREHGGAYGYNGDRVAERATHLYWTRLLFAYDFPDDRRLGVDMNFGAGTGVDRFSAYRVGGMLQNNAEFPMSVPGYFSQEIAAEKVAHVWLRFGKSLTNERRIVFNWFAGGAVIKPVPTTDAGGAQHAGVGMGVEFLPKREGGALRGMLSFGYSPTAVRGDHRGGEGVALSMELNLGTTPPPSGPSRLPDTQGGLRWLIGSPALP